MRRHYAGLGNASILLLSVIILGAFCAGGTAFAVSIPIVDQSNPGPYTGTNGSFTRYFGQSFTPSLPAIDAFVFQLGSSGGTDMVVDLLYDMSGPDGLGGSIMSTSLPTFVSTSTPGADTMFRFDFPSRVVLEPGHTYVGRLRNLGSHSFGVRWTSDLYSGGQFLHGGFAPGGFPHERDMVFSEGLIPEPATLSLLGLALAGVGIVSARRARRRARQRRFPWMNGA